MSGHAEHNYDDPTAPPRLCQNCTTPLRGPYCTHCGQHDVDYHHSFWHLTHDLLENLFHFEGKFFTSVAWLLAKPGHLTNEFNAGRRQSQLNPLRFYIFVTVLFFLGVHVLNDGHLFKFDSEPLDKAAAHARAIAAIPKTANDFTPEQAELFGELLGETMGKNPSGIDHKTVEELVARVKHERPASPLAKPSEGTPQKNPPKKRPKSENTGVLGELERSFKSKVESGELTWARFQSELEHRVPTLLFLGMPLFALLLKIFYWRRRRYYIEHLIFSIHLHTWVFLALVVSFGYFALAALGPSWLTSLVAWAFALWLVGYVLVAFRTVYAQSWVRTVIKIALLSTGYVFALLWVALALIVFTAWRLIAA